MANAGILPALAGPDDLIVIDELGHASPNGRRAARSRTLTFRHNDARDSGHCRTRENIFFVRVVVTEGVFSMDGDRAPLDDPAAVCACNDAWLMVDDAHGFGVLGAAAAAPSNSTLRPISPCRWAPSPAAGGMAPFCVPACP